MVTAKNFIDKNVKNFVDNLLRDALQAHVTLNHASSLLKGPVQNAAKDHRTRQVQSNVGRTIGINCYISNFFLSEI